MKGKKQKRSNTDRISDLPISIIHNQILSRLSRRDRARISISSKTWYRLNKTYPALDFDFGCFFKYSWKEKSDYVGAVEKFRKRAYKSLRRFSQKYSCLHSLRVNTTRYSYKEQKSDVRRWARIALEYKVKELNLYFPCSNPRLSLLHPDNNLAATLLTTLKLANCVLYQPLSVFSSLRNLTLYNCGLRGPIVLEHSDCPALESLALNRCHGFNSLRISNLVRLRTVVLDLHERSRFVNIASQSVQNVSIIARSRWEDINIDDCNRLRLLHLYSYTDTITDQGFHNLVSKFPLLEELHVGCEGLEAIQVSNPQLETLVVSSYTPCLRRIDIAAPTLKNFVLLSDNSIRAPIKVKVRADCCGSLETLALCNAVMKDKKFHKLVAKFPQLQSLWIFGCHELRTIEILNLQLRKLHIAQCSELKAVKVDSNKLFEMYCRSREDLEISQLEV